MRIENGIATARWTATYDQANSDATGCATLHRAPRPFVPPSVAKSRPGFGNATLVEYPSRDALMIRLAEKIARRIAELIETQDVARIAVPGVAALEPMFLQLGQTALDWQKVVVTLTDEGWVRTQVLRSQERMLADPLLTGAACAAEYSPLYCEARSQKVGIREAEATLRRTTLPLDIALLDFNAHMGVGSLVPNARGLEDALSMEADPVVPIRTPRTMEPRIALSVPTLTAAERHILVVGPKNRAALDSALRLNDPSSAPVCAVLDDAIVHVAD